MTSGQTAKDAIMALKKLDARVETGISYKDYAPALGEAKFPVNLFLESSKAKENPELTVHIRKAIRYFQTPNLIWEYKLSNGNIISTHADCGKIISRDFPDLEIEGFIYIPDALNSYWNEAGKEIKFASDIYANLDSKTTSAKQELEKIKQENESLRKENEMLKAENKKVQHELLLLKKNSKSCLPKKP